MGVRSEEICGARVGDIRFADEIAYLAITDSKTDSSTRDVPPPAVLLDLGFLEHRVIGRDADERLFAELIEQGAADRAPEALGDRFTYYRQKIKAYVEGMDFHALRHNVRTDLANMPGVKDIWIDEITGHESDARSSETSRYTKGIYLKHLKAALDRITLPVDLTHLAYSGERGTPAPEAHEQIRMFTDLAEQEMRKKARRG